MRILIAEIVAGTHAEGARMRTEHELAEEFSISRGVVREAIRGLEERGLIRVKHGRGAMIAPSRNWNVLDADVLEELLRTSEGPKVLTELLECRRALEVEAAGMAAERADGHALSKIADALAAMQAAASLAATSLSAGDVYHEADIDFHRAIIAATGNRAMSRLLDPVRQALVTARRPTAAEPEERARRIIPQHRALLTAIASRDSVAACAAMTAHFATIEGYLQEYAKRQVSRVNSSAASGELSSALDHEMIAETDSGL